ncbi:MAG TPA: glycoside hydrolase domain-containing protein [Bryobacteraceae bacterium]|nr:glycoside hydrolase domain-containing protein [Bryobacteraceae bacterium]
MTTLQRFLAAAVLPAAFALPGVAQRGDLPVPADLEDHLQRRGYAEKFLPAQDETLAPKPEDTRRGWLVYHRDRNYEVLPNSKPGPSETLDVLRLTATPGEIESESFSVYALRDVLDLSVSGKITGASGGSTWLASATKVEDVLFHPIQYRGEDEERTEKTYLRYPMFIRPASAHPAPKGTSRLYWVTVSVPESTSAGVFRTAIEVGDGSGNRLRLPLEVEVLPFTLTRKGVPAFGAFLSGQSFAKGEWAFMKRYGMDALQWFWGSHAIEIRNDNGRVKMDFTKYDAFVQGMKDAGMRGPLVLSLGNSWLGHYEIKLAEAFGLRLMKRELEGRTVTLMDITDPRWEKPYLEGLRLIFDHAKTAGWPPLALLINDEPTKHIMAYYPYRYHLIKKHFPDIPIYGVFFQPEKDPGPLLHSCDIMVANRDLDRIRTLARDFGKRFWTYNNVTADESFGKIRLLYGQIPAYYGSEVMFFWCWNYYVGNPWDDFDGWSEKGTGPAQSDADWVAVYPSVDGVEPVRTLGIEAAREAIDDVRYLKTLENVVAEREPARLEAVRGEIRRRQKAMFDGIILNNRIYSDKAFFVSAKNDDVEKLRRYAVQQILETLKRSQ